MLTVSIVNHLSGDVLIECLESLREEGVFEYARVVVTNNTPEDGVGERVRAFEPSIVVIDNQVRRGFAANHNRVLAACEDEFCLILNPDTMLRGGAVLALLDALARHPDGALAAPAIEGRDGALEIGRGRVRLPRDVGRCIGYIAGIDVDSVFQRARRAIGSPRPEARMRVEKAESDARHSADEDAREVELVNGCCMLVRCSVFEGVGLMDERFFLYYEEVDWVVRMREQGWKIYVVSAARVLHVGGQSTHRSEEDYKHSLSRYCESCVRFHAKHSGALVGRGVHIILLLTTLGSAAVFYVLSWKDESMRLRWQREQAVAGRLLSRDGHESPSGSDSVGPSR